MSWYVVCHDPEWIGGTKVAREGFHTREDAEEWVTDYEQWRDRGDEYSDCPYDHTVEQDPDSRPEHP